MNALLPEQQVGVIVLSNADSLHGRSVTIPEELGARILDFWFHRRRPTWTMRS